MSGRRTRGGLLYSPVRVGALELRNRIVFSAHLTNAAEDGLPTAQHAAYYAARAAGGVGLVITEEHSVHPADRPYEKLIRGGDPATLPGYRRITDAVHAHGVPVLAQLNHNGGQSSGRYSREPLWAPSAVADPMFREVPVAVTATEIAELVASYARAAQLCADGGFDGIELQCSHASILRQFLSPLTNRRTDSYGGSITGRARIVREVAAAVREAVGRQRVVSVRLCGDEGIPGGTPVDEAVAVAELLEQDGTVDMVNTSVGVATATLHLIEAPMTVPAGYALHVPAAIRRAVALPVLGVGRFTTHADAERAIAEGHCDLVGVVRGQVADAGWAAAPTTPCVGCNQDCVGRVGLNQRLRCVVNPRAGRESLPLPVARRARRVLVVGGGPAGLRAAATAAERGHAVLLCERGPRTGGQVAVAASAPHRAEFGGVVTALLVACERAGVELRTGTPVDAALVEEIDPDAVVLATGAVPGKPTWAGETDRIVDVRDVLECRADPRGDVVVYDELGFHQATSVAELLAARGCSVEIVTPGAVVAQDLGLTLDMERFHRRAHTAGITLRRDRVVTAAVPRAAGMALTVLRHTTGEVEERHCDWVVSVVPSMPDDALWRQLSAGHRPVHRIGDCLAPRRADAAIREGERIGVEL